MAKADFEPDTDANKKMCGEMCGEWIDTIDLPDLETRGVPGSGKSKQKRGNESGPVMQAQAPNSTSQTSALQSGFPVR
ncbi:MAG: hypothetical protein WCJ97_03600 [Phycisphaerae bacterium]